MQSPRHALAFLLFLLFGLATGADAQEGATGLTAPRPAAAPPAAAPPAPPSPALAPPAPPPIPVPARVGAGIIPLGVEVATRLRALDGSLRILGQRGRRPVDGIMSIVSGALSITFGAITASDFAGYDSPPSGYFYLWGAAGIAQGVLNLTLTPDATDLAIRYAHLPMTNPQEVQLRLRFGEESLEYLASRYRTLRMLDASISVAAGLLVIPVYLGPNDFHVDGFLDYFVIVGASVSIISGIMGFASRSEAERRWKAYEQLRDGLEARRPQADAGGLRLVGFSAAPLRGGGGAVGVLTAF